MAKFWVAWNLGRVIASLICELQSEACIVLVDDTNTGILYSMSLDLRESHLRDIYTISFWTPFYGAQSHNEMNQSQLWPTKNKNKNMTTHFMPSIYSIDYISTHLFDT